MSLVPLLTADMGLIRQNGGFAATRVKASQPAKRKTFPLQRGQRSCVFFAPSPLCPTIHPTLLSFGLLIGSTLGGNLTPVGASANITGIGILRREGYEVKNSDFLRIGVPFPLAAVITGYLILWLQWA